ncbi:geranylgeranyl pyrophosphate synthase-like protein [Anaeromyces robustus]|uniref:Geranylgeranyl pyrophosphate synthase-like protein n=1 Tax=Anaeromyces robustus TaxID=1754192 RepID=A0A1Y1XF05_9FUNG|nr:geranylgeranyl pyrophosphate synthase-like protein [Anaeromyces robustus]|eukprot:ORX84338.1 geranylgeranyl pyrophosphate synthase-like protein [Anaeromyces robustus]
MDSTIKEKHLLEPYTYLLQHPGKDIRSKLIDAFDIWLDVPKYELKVIKEVIEMLHTSSLLIDDVEDDSELRRGVPVAHKIFGIPSTISCANYVYFIALQKLLDLKNFNLITIYTDELLNLHRGQGMEIYFRDSSICPTEDDYMDIVSNKTGGLLRLGVKLMEELSTTNKLNGKYVDLANTIGEYYQIRDDYSNLLSETYKNNKGFCEDITEGKYSYPIIHCIKNHPESHQLEKIIRQKTSNVELKTYCIKLMRESHSFEYTKQKLISIEEKMKNQIDNLGGNAILIKMIDELSKIYKEEDK